MQNPQFCGNMTEHMSESLYSKIEQRLTALNLSARAASLRATGKPDTIRNIQRGRRPRSDTLENLARALECSVAWLMGEDTTPPYRHIAPTDSPSTYASGTPLVSAPLHGAGRRDLPVLGVAVAGQDGMFEMTEQPHDYIERPACLEGIDDAYAVYIQDSSMEPRYFLGEAVCVHPGRPITRNCFVVVQFEPDTPDAAPQAMIKQFVQRTATDLVLYQYNPAGELEFPLSTVRSVHRIIWSGEG